MRRIFPPLPRALTLLASAVAAAGVGWLWVFSLGQGFRPPGREVIDGSEAPINLSDDYARTKARPAYAVVESVRLPIGARSFEDLKSLVVKINEDVADVDDYMRIYVNNKLVSSTDIPARPFRYFSWNRPPSLPFWRTPDPGAMTARFALDRATPVRGENDVRPFLRRGLNWIMVELDNSRWGHCWLSLTLSANGVQLEGSPYALPGGIASPEMFTHHATATAISGLAEKSLSKGAFALRPELDAVCARVAFAFTLD